MGKIFKIQVIIPFCIQYLPGNNSSLNNYPDRAVIGAAYIFKDESILN
jgi:hypothetical protein